eukprot:scaffold2803_cov347-Prasinococcus_capsulatus_cf.AAC.13
MAERLGNRVIQIGTRALCPAYNADLAPAATQCMASALRAITRPGRSSSRTLIAVSIPSTLVVTPSKKMRRNHPLRTQFCTSP